MTRSSVIIRTRNESRWIGEVLTRLTKQTNQDFEVIVVDSGSVDNTLSIVDSFKEKLNLDVYSIPQEDFSYPYAINYGIKQISPKSSYLVILSAHSLPINNRWLESGLAKFHLGDNIMGVYGPLLALPDGTIWDKAFYNPKFWLGRFWYFLRGGYKVVKCNGMGVLGFTNAVIRKDLWDKYPLNEDFAGGGEDGDWAQHWFDEGYVAVKDYNFSVRHSHYLDFRGWRGQLAHWRSVAKPRPYERQTYRKDGAHN